MPDDLHERIGVLEAKHDMMAKHIDVFKEESRSYRDANAKNIKCIQKDMNVLIGWVSEEKTRRKTVKKIILGCGWLLGIMATMGAVIKNSKHWL